MKKIFLFTVFSVYLGVGTLQAQDTLWMKPAPLGNYFSNNWIDTTERYVARALLGNRSHALARQFVNKDDTLQVYGIAAMMMNLDSLFFEPSSYYPDLRSYLEDRYPEDPTFDNCKEHLMLFQYHGAPTPTMLQQGDSLSVHILHTPVSYWIMSNTSPVSTWDTCAKPVYERFFSSPQTVYDTFYVGFTISYGGYSKEDSLWHETRPSFPCICFNSFGRYYAEGEKVADYWQETMSSPREWYFHDRFQAFFIFPILTPPDTTPLNPNDTVVNPNDTVVVNPGDTLVVLPGDTLVIGGDTLVNSGDTLVIIPGEPFVIGGDTLVVNPGDSIVVIPGTGPLSLRQSDFVYRYTALQPNPATDQVRVTSSFGISRIEAYDLRGRLIYESPQLSTFSFPLSTIEWPRGTYLLRITTPAGTTTKKLLLR